MGDSVRGLFRLAVAILVGLGGANPTWAQEVLPFLQPPRPSRVFSVDNFPTTLATEESSPETSSQPGIDSRPILDDTLAGDNSFQAYLVERIQQLEQNQSRLEHLLYERDEWLEDILSDSNAAAAPRYNATGTEGWDHFGGFATGGAEDSSWPTPLMAT